MHLNSVAFGFLQVELGKFRPSEKDTGGKKKPKREVLPAHLPGREVRNDHENTTCGRGRAPRSNGQDAAEKLNRALAHTARQPHPGFAPHHWRPVHHHRKLNRLGVVKTG